MGRPKGSKNIHQKEHLKLALPPETMQVIRERAASNYLPVNMYVTSMLMKAIAREDKADEQK